MTFHIKTQEFSGPLELLLELINSQQLPITDVSLAQVADSYVAHVNENTVPPEELADFLVVSSRLLLIKSRAILPEIELEEEVGPSLGDQLKMYKRFVEASVWIGERFGAPVATMTRPRAPRIQKEPVFSAPENVTGHVLKEHFDQLLKRLKPFFQLAQTSMERVVSVAHRLEEIRSVLLTRSQLTFRDATRGARTKVDVVVSFLALLELVKTHVVDVVQGDTFDDIVIKHVD